ncbi:TRAP transporter substrate-binding protein DctP [Undibacter mobilis]|uniref:TRAP transporter substrate-binding protein DctP n=1 Tax=Undibacter mobilis TaxID=2292256 RepID=UPI00143D0334|nr:TRAP transporter substrate-binding protein DctP [Undibacter mobilis]
MAQPVQLKLSYFGPDKAQTFQAGIKPFVDAVNAEGKGVVSIVIYADGALGKSIAEQPALIQKEVADIAWVVPGQTPYRFPDDEIFQLPGLARDVREGTLAYTRLVAAGRLRGYQDYFVVGAYVTSPAFIHTRKPVASIAALRGLKIRANNAIEAEALERLGVIATVMPVSQVATAIKHGAIDGAVVALPGLFDFGIADVATHHFHLAGGGAPVAMLMNRKKFAALPDAAKHIIHKYSGEWAAAHWIEAIAESEKQGLAVLRSDPKRVFTEPSQHDLDTASRAVRSLIDGWAAANTRNRDLLRHFEADLSVIRSTVR